MPRAGRLARFQQCLVPEQPGSRAAATQAIGARAAESLRRAVQLGPATPQLYNNLALALKDEGLPDEALAAFDAALAIRGDYATGHFNRANLLLEAGRLDEAVAGYRCAIEADPRDAGAWCKLGVAQFDRGQLPEAVHCFEQALSLQPGYAEARRNRGMAWLAQGDYARGWPEFEHRLVCDGFVPRVTDGPRWRGEPLAGRTLLVHAEQGLGDTLQFVRYVPLVEKWGGRVRLQVQPALVPLLRQSGFERWLLATDESPSYDVQCPLMSLPGIVPDDAGLPYWCGPYLAANPDLVARWEKPIHGLGPYRVGIAWSGNPEHPHNRFRSVDLAAFAPLSSLPGVHLVSLQKGNAREQRTAVSNQFDVADLGTALDESAGAFMDTAAVMQHLDLIIAVDTSLVHLAGGAGTPHLGSACILARLALEAHRR